MSVASWSLAARNFAISFVSAAMSRSRNPSWDRFRDRDFVSGKKQRSKNRSTMGVSYLIPSPEIMIQHTLGVGFLHLAKICHRRR